MSAMPSHTAIRKISAILAIIANKYMKTFQGDIIYDYMGIIERVQFRGEVECYISTGHFDTEKRFELMCEGNTTAARQKARQDHWGEYIMLIKVNEDKVSLGVESGIETRILPSFPLDEMLNKTLPCVDELLYDRRTPLTVSNITKMCEYDEENKCFTYTPKEYEMFSDPSVTKIVTLTVKDGKMGGITDEGERVNEVWLDKESLNELKKDIEYFFEKHSWMRKC